MRSLLLGILATGILFDLASFVAWAHPALAAPFALIVIGAATIAAFRDIRFGVAAVLLELLWGSHGYLLRLPAGGVDLSLRMGLFLGVLAATIWHLRTRTARVGLWDALRTHPIRWPAFALLATLALGFILGFIRHPFDRVFFDANAWGFLVLAPAFLLAASSGGQPFYGHGAPQGMQNAKCKMQNDEAGSFFIHHSSFIILAGALYLILRIYLLIFVFSHDLGGTWMPFYQWIRDTRLGEITVFPGGFPRVFLPSMVLLFPAIAIAVTRIYEWMRINEYANTAVNTWRVAHGEWSILSLAVFGGGIAVLIASLSRSYWLAGVVLIVAGVMWSAVQLLWQRFHSHFRTKMRMSIGSILALIVSAAVALALVVAVVRLPYPTPLTTAGVGGTLLARLSTDAAVSNRWQQLGPLWDSIRTHLVFGNGFGAAVTYESRDPRTLAAFPDGRYTTTAFEWGYLDDFLERGIVGLLAELWFLGALIWFGIRRGGESAAFALGLLAIVIVHATSPYVNHPLGIGATMLLFAIVTSTDGGRRNTPPASFRASNASREISQRSDRGLSTRLEMTLKMSNSAVSDEALTDGMRSWYKE